MLCVIFGLVELALAIYGGYMLVQRVRGWIDEAIDEFYAWQDQLERRRKERERRRREQRRREQEQWRRWREEQKRQEQIRRNNPTPPQPQGTAPERRPITPFMEAVSDGSAVTTMSPAPEYEYKPRRAYYPDTEPAPAPAPKAKQAEGVVSLPFKETWKSGSLSKVEMNESMLILETDDTNCFVVDDAALPDYVQEFKRAGYDVQVSRKPNSRPSQYVLKLQRPY